MSFESGERFSSENVGGGGLPMREDIHMEDCTMSVIAGSKVGVEEAKELLKSRIVEKSGKATTYDCKACLGKFTVSGFANVEGAFSCRSNFREDATQIIAKY